MRDDIDNGGRFTQRHQLRRNRALTELAIAPLHANCAHIVAIFVCGKFGVIQKFGGGFGNIIILVQNFFNLRIADKAPHAIGTQQNGVAFGKFYAVGKVDLWCLLAAHAIVNFIFVRVCCHFFFANHPFFIEWLYDRVIFGAEQQMPITEVIKSRVADMRTIQKAALNNGRNNRGTRRFNEFISLRHVFNHVVHLLNMVG